MVTQAECDQLPLIAQIAFLRRAVKIEPSASGMAQHRGVSAYFPTPVIVCGLSRFILMDTCWLVVEKIQRFIYGK